MVFEDDMPKKTSQRFTPPNLESWSIEDLSLYKESLEEEIKRVEKNIESKKAARKGADAVFKI